MIPSFSAGEESHDVRRIVILNTIQRPLEGRRVGYLPGSDWIRWSDYLQGEQRD